MRVFPKIDYDPSTPAHTPVATPATVSPAEANDPLPSRLSYLVSRHGPPPPCAPASCTECNPSQDRGVASAPTASPLAPRPSVPIWLPFRPAISPTRRTAARAQRLATIPGWSAGCWCDRVSAGSTPGRTSSAYATVAPPSDATAAAGISAAHPKASCPTGPGLRRFRYRLRTAAPSTGSRNHQPTIYSLIQQHRVSQQTINRRPTAPQTTDSPFLHGSLSVKGVDSGVVFNETYSTKRTGTRYHRLHPRPWTVRVSHNSRATCYCLRRREANR